MSHGADLCLALFHSVIGLTALLSAVKVIKVNTIVHCWVASDLVFDKCALIWGHALEARHP